MRKHILVVPGDGIGQEVTQVGKKVLERVAEKFGHDFTYDEALIGHVAIEATGDPLPEETLVKMRSSDAILLVQWDMQSMITIPMPRLDQNKVY